MTFLILLLNVVAILIAWHWLREPPEPKPPQSQSRLNLTLDGRWSPMVVWATDQHGDPWMCVLSEWKHHDALRDGWGAILPMGIEAANDYERQVIIEHWASLPWRPV